VGRGQDVDGALDAAYGGVAHISFPGMQWRTDIGRTDRAALAGIAS
jgi:phosphoribosylamine-glycine ligase